MSESAEPAAHTLEVKESEQQQKIEKENVQEQRLEIDKVEKVGVEEIKEKRIVQELSQLNQNQDQIQEQKHEEDQNTEQEDQEIRQQKEHVLKQEQEREQKEDQIQKSKEDNQENILEKIENSMQLPITNLSEKAIEDEEMPSMVSTSSPSRIDESESVIKQDSEKILNNIEDSESKFSPAKEDDNESVYVIDDDDDEEEEGDRSFDDDDESSSYHDDDSEEMYRENYNENYDRRHARNARRTEDEDDEEEEDEEYAEDDSEIDRFDGSSDDLVLRYSNGFTKHEKERSASLQDLSLIKGSSPKSKHNVNPFNQKTKFEKSQINVEDRTPHKQYSHIESEIKKYIKDIKHQTKLSDERRKKAQAEEEAKQKNEDISDAQIYRKQEVVKTCRTIKDYTEKTLKEVAEYEENNEKMYVVPQTVENGELSIFPTNFIGNGESISQQEEMDVDPISVESQRIEKTDGIVKNERKGIQRRDEQSLKPILNGEDSVSNLRTLTYEEYMKGSVNKETNRNNAEEIQNTLEKCNNNDTESPCVLRIENITSNYCSEVNVDDSFHDRKTPVMMLNQPTELYQQDNHEMSSITQQLYKQNSAFGNLREVYQKTLSENIAIKMELENLKKLLLQYQTQQKSMPETKTVAIQTETYIAAPYIPEDRYEQNNPKLPATSMISQVSTQWSDSTGSAAFSMEPPPNVTNALNSDESSYPPTKTPLKQKNILSRAFMTSSKILQTLSNITHGKSKSDKHGNKYSKTSACESENEAATSAQNDKLQFLETQSSKSRKRKATDTMEISSSAQPSKIPHTSKLERERKNQILNTPEPQLIDLDDDNNDAEKDEDKIQDMNEDDIKVFIYPEDEGGKEHSFLIQTKEITNNPKSGVRECGPYLLGNVEVYMTEMNGTINIWGKELSQGSTNQNIEDLESSTRSKDLRQNFRWQSTPRLCSNQQSASTSKKSKIISRFSQVQQKQDSYEMNNTITECDNSHRLSCPSCNHYEYEHQHTCCYPAVRIEETRCGCNHRIERQHNEIGSCRRLQKCKDSHRISLPDVYHGNSICYCHNYHNHCRNPIQEKLCNHQTFVRRHSFNPTDEEDDSGDEENIQLASKFVPSSRENSPHSLSNEKLIPPPPNNRRNSGDNVFDPTLSQNESDPLISQKQTLKEPEVRKRKLSGRKVRGLLMDLLKGCGDCRTTNPMNKTNLRNNASIYEPSSITRPRISCSPHQPSCSLRSNEKCSSCRTKNDKTTEIETKLEIFRVELEEMRKRSEIMCEMLDTLRKEETTN